MTGTEHPPLSRFDLSEVPEPANGVLYLVKGRDGFWRIRNDPDIAQEEATGYPVGELVEHEDLGDYDDAESGELLAIYLPWADEFAEEYTMYCPDCDAWVAENWDPIEEVWRCPVCEATPIYDDKEQYVEVCHATARFNKQNGYGPWYDRDEDEDPEIATDGGQPSTGTERSVDRLAGELFNQAYSPHYGVRTQLKLAILARAFARWELQDEAVRTDGGGAERRWCEDCEEETPHRQVGDETADGPTYQCLGCPERMEIEAALGGESDAE